MDINFFNRWSVYFIQKLMSDFKLDLLSSVAIVGNAGHESNGFQSLQEKKPLVHGSKGGYGIMQWTGPRRRDYESYCKRNGFDPSDMEVNYKFLFVELSGWEGRNVLPALKAAKGLDEKTKVFMKKFLRPGIEHLPSRLVWSKRAYEAYQDAMSSSGIESTPDSPEAPQEAPVSDSDSIWTKILELILKILRKTI